MAHRQQQLVMHMIQDVVHHRQQHLQQLIMHLMIIHQVLLVYKFLLYFLNHYFYFYYRCISWCTTTKCCLFSIQNRSSYKWFIIGKCLCNLF
jgi:hypothetical protein